MDASRIILILLVAFLVWRVLSTRIGLVSISGADLQKRLGAGESLLIVDVREPGEFEQGHLKGARLLPLGEVRRGGHDLPQDRPIVLVCQSGSRSAQAFHALKRQGYTNLFNLTGGMAGWPGTVVR